MVDRDGFRCVACFRRLGEHAQNLPTISITAPPYLLSLGIPRDLMSLVLLAAPLSGLVVQPIIGHYADHSKSRYGRRRPYMFVGTILAGLSMLLLGYGKPAVELVFGADSKVVNSQPCAHKFVSYVTHGRVI